MPTWTAIAHPGLENVVAAELREHGFTVDVQAGWVRFEGDARTVCAALPMLRTPDRVLLQIVEARAQGSDGLAGVVRSQAWKEWITPEATIEVDVHGGGRFKDSVEKRVVWTIHEALRGPRIPEQYARPRLTQRVSVVFDRSGERVTVSLDAGGGLLHRRGWRTDISKAPLRENLAAALLRLSGWRPGEVLIDPFCGSGTIGIEAALMAAGRSPFLRPAFACSEWPALRVKPGARTRGAPGVGAPGVGARGAGAPRVGARDASGRGSGATAAIYSSDRDAKVVRAAEANATRAGVNVSFQTSEIADLIAPATKGYIVTNPPWGHRLNEARSGQAGGRVIPATDIFNRFAIVLGERFAGWKVVFLAPERDLARRLSPQVRPLATFPNGGVRITAWGLG
ncbi:MAG: hypothetical protein EXR69_15365 [Myxococcales bacterium]|nr:hypothetical protein [Myxococcales bacterium]